MTKDDRGVPAGCGRTWPGSILQSEKITYSIKVIEANNPFQVVQEGEWPTAVPGANRWACLRRSTGDLLGCKGWTASTVLCAPSPNPQAVHQGAACTSQGWTRSV